MKILIIAPPRSGTGYAAKCFQDIGLDVGHERLNSNGISSWLWAVDCYDDARWGHNYQDIKPDMTIMLRRRPEDIVCSLAYSASNALDWMEKYVPVFGGTIVEKASKAVLGWTKKCLQREPDYIVSLDDLPVFLAYQFGEYPNENLRGYNNRPHRLLSKNELKIIEDDVIETRVLIDDYIKNCT